MENQIVEIPQEEEKSRMINNFHKTSKKLRMTEPIFESIARIEKKKHEEEILINKQKEIVSGVFYIAYYKVYDGYEKIDYGMVGIFDSHFLASKACMMTQEMLMEKYEDEDLIIKVEYTDFNLNHIVF